MYRALLIFVVTLASATNGMHWAKWRVKCSTEKYGVMTHSAQLMDIHGSWEAACERTGANIKHRDEEKWTEFKRPTRCINNFGMWGEFDVPSKDCRGHYESFSDQGCVELLNGVRQYEGKLVSVPHGFSWEQAIQQTGATIDGIWIPAPATYINSGYHMYGVFHVPSESCKRHWVNWRDDGCRYGKRNWLADLTGHLGHSHIKNAQRTAGSFNGRHFDGPTLVQDHMNNHYIGRFIFEDPTCADPIDSGNNGQSEHGPSDNNDLPMFGFSSTYNKLYDRYLVLLTLDLGVKFLLSEDGLCEPAPPHKQGLRRAESRRSQSRQHPKPKSAMTITSFASSVTASI